MKASAQLLIDIRASDAAHLCQRHGLLPHPAKP